MTCDKCEYLKIIYEPLRMEGIPLALDFGKAKCIKHSLYTYFLNHKKFKTLTCPKELVKDINIPGKDAGKTDEVSE